MISTGNYIKQLYDTQFGSMKIYVRFDLRHKQEHMHIYINIRCAAQDTPNLKLNATML